MALVKAIEEEAARLGFDSIFTSTDTAKGILERRGWQAYGTTETPQGARNDLSLASPGRGRRRRDECPLWVTTGPQRLPRKWSAPTHRNGGMHAPRARAYCLPGGIGARSNPVEGTQIGNPRTTVAV